MDGKQLVHPCQVMPGEVLYMDHVLNEPVFFSYSKRILILCSLSGTVMRRQSIFLLKVGEAEAFGFVLCIGLQFILKKNFFSTVCLVRIKQYIKEPDYGFFYIYIIHRRQSRLHYLLLNFSVIWNQSQTYEEMYILMVVGKCSFDVECYFFITHIVESGHSYNPQYTRLKIVQLRYPSDPILEASLGGLKPAQCTHTHDLGLSSYNYKFISSVRLGV